MRSLDNNQLCGISSSGKGTFTLDAINALCEALPKSSVISLRCALAFWVSRAILPGINLPYLAAHLPLCAPRSLSSNNINAEAGVKLAEGFAQMPNLREVK